MNEKKPVVGRRDFIKRLMQGGLTYDKAVSAYTLMLSTIADGVVSGQAIYLGDIGSIVPTVCQPRKVNLGCRRQKGGKVVKIKQEFFLDTRLRYKFRLFKNFLATHQLAWHSS
jgi:hypothetical protein